MSVSTAALALIAWAMIIGFTVALIRWVRGADDDSE